jgi:hypothetical protein
MKFTGATIEQMRPTVVALAPSLCRRNIVNFTHDVVTVMPDFNNHWLSLLVQVNFLVNQCDH